MRAVREVRPAGEREDHVAANRGGAGPRQELRLRGIHEQKRWRKSAKRLEG